MVLPAYYCFTTRDGVTKGQIWLVGETIRKLTDLTEINSNLCYTSEKNVLPNHRVLQFTAIEEH